MLTHELILDLDGGVCVHSGEDMTTNVVAFFIVKTLRDNRGHTMHLRRFGFPSDPFCVPRTIQQETT